MSAAISNAWDAAANATEVEYSNQIFGQIEFDVWFCILQKGMGKVPFDPNIHPISQRRTAVDVSLTDLSGLNISRSFIAEIGTDGWLKVTLPSLKALNTSNLQEFSGSWVHAEIVPFGKYTNAEGEERNRTAPKVLSVFDSQEACEAAAHSTNAPGTSPLEPRSNGTLSQNGTAHASPQSAGPSHANGSSDAERQVALQFLPAIVKNCLNGNGIDYLKLESALSSNPILAKHFTVASPEVAQAMSLALAAPAF